MNCLENFYIQQFQFQGTFIDEENVGEMNPSLALAQKTDDQYESAQIIHST